MPATNIIIFQYIMIKNAITYCVNLIKLARYSPLKKFRTTVVKI